MNTKLILAASIILVTGILGIAASSLGIECYNAHESYKEENRQKESFLIFIIVSTVFMVLSASALSAAAVRF